MSDLSIEQVFNLALQHHQAGRLNEAEQLYRQILARQPEHAGALHYLGVLAHHRGRNVVAADLIRRAIALRPNDPAARNNLGNALQAMGQLDEAISAYRQALALKPGNPQAYNNLGNCLKAKGDLDEAIAAYRQALALESNYPEAHSNLGNALTDQGQLDEAIAACQRAITFLPDFAEAYSNLGNALQAKGMLAEAMAAYGQALALKPDLPEAHSNLGNALRAKGRLDEAIAAHRRALALCPNFQEGYYNLGNVLKDNGQLAEAIAVYRQALAIRPNDPEVHNNLGNVLRDNGQVDEAIAAYRQALAFRPGYAEAHGNLGNVLKDKACLNEAIAAYREALALKPNFPEAHSNLVYTLHFHPGYDAQAICHEQRCWNEQHAEPLKKPILPSSASSQMVHANGRDPERRLRIGYVSPDFREQAEAFFTIPLFENHDHTRFAIFCYSSAIKPDRITQRLQASADIWRDVGTETDESLAAIIRDDGIDVLVDLTMHMAKNRALLFARKPAPVQVCWLAYPGGTGLETMDYRITDSFMDPFDADTSCYVEQSIRLPNCWVVYNPLIDLPVRPPEQAGPITFGSLNNPCKLNEPLLALWAKVLQAAPGSRLTLLVLSLEHRQRILRLMDSLGIAKDRLQFVGRTARREYLRSHDKIDIALDPLPYNGITTTCDALYMGTPVLTLAGRTAAGRAGKAMLNTIGLGELVSHNPDEFVGCAAQLAADIPRLIEIRRGLRQRLILSPLMDGPRFARSMESAYRQMWCRWCQSNCQ